MHRPRYQRTIAAPVTVEGVGYWSGRDVRVEFRPAPANSGITFVRTDLAGQPRITADVEHRVEMPRRTTLQSGGASVEMIEHAMAALAGLEIDNCELRVDQAEMPGFDGSSQAFVEAIDAAGVVVQDAPRRVHAVAEYVRLGTESTWIEAWPCSGETVLYYELDYGSHTPIGRQTFQITLTPETFRRELACCRTFVLKAEAEAFLAQGLGGRTTLRDLLVFDDRGPIDNELRFPDECVRHKMLDMVGDLALAGCDLRGRFIARRSGHRLNADLVRTVLAQKEVCRLRRCA